MADVFNKTQRSRCMAAIKGSGNKDTELRLLRIMRSNRISGWRRHQALPGRPDFTFRKEKVAVFVDGCFWHGCPKHGRNPATNRAYWVPKLLRNKKRDVAVKRMLKNRGWKTIRLWEHELSDSEKVARRIIKSLGRELSGLQSSAI